MFLKASHPLARIRDLIELMVDLIAKVFVNVHQNYNQIWMTKFDLENIVFVTNIDNYYKVMPLGQKRFQLISKMINEVL